MKLKKLKKWVAGMMLPVTALSAFAGAVAIDTTINTTQINAASVNGNVATFTDFSFDQYGDTWMQTETLSGTFGAGVYYADITFKNLPSDFVSIESIDARLIDYNGIHGVVESKSGKSARIKFTVNSVQSGLGLYIYSLRYNTSSGSRDFIPESTPFESAKITFPAIDEQAPVFETQVFLTDVDNPISLEDILKEVSFIDGVDGVLPVTEADVTSDNYSDNKYTVGKWEIVVSKSDSSGNTNSGTIEVWVQDKTSPIITGKTTFTSYMSNPLTIEGILSQLTATDNVDGDVSHKISVVSNNFTGNEHILGNKDIVVDVTDNAGNVSVKTTLKVNCVDDVKPVISLKEGYGYSYVTSYENKLNINTILEGVVVTDNIDNNLSYEVIENKYEGNDKIPNTYTIKIRATDSAGNVSDTTTFTIQVTDEIPPVFYVSGKFIGITQAQTLTHQEIVNLLLYMEELATEGAAVNVLSFDGYETEAVNSPGVYTLRYQTRTAEGVESEVKTATIKVLGDVQEDIDSNNQVEQESNGFWEKLGDFFLNLWKKICSWFKGLFKKD